MRFYISDISKTKLTNNQKLVWIMLFSHADNKTHQCYPSFNTLARESSLTVPTVSKCLDALEAKHIIKREPRFKEDGGKTSNLYTLMPKGMWDKSVLNIGKSAEKEDATLEATEHETSTGAENLDKVAEENKVAEVSTEAMEQAKEQINYHSIVANHIEDKAVVDLMLEVITENQMQNITESMCVHVLERIQGYQPKNLKAYLKTLLLNQPNEEATDLWKDKQTQTQEGRRIASPNNRFHNFQQRTYDYDELNARILNRDL